jgi:hypothetical protein
MDILLIGGMGIQLLIDGPFCPVSLKWNTGVQVLFEVRYPN